MTRTRITVPQVRVGKYCGRGMHDLCSWDPCQCTCHTHKKVEKLMNDDEDSEKN